MKRFNFYFNGESSADHGMYCLGVSGFSAPQRQYTSVSVPGRNGDLHFDTKRYANISVEYRVFFDHNADAKMEDARNWLNSFAGSYERLTDDIHPDEYRMAAYVEGFVPTISDELERGTAKLTFDCKPQRFLLSGDSWITVETGGTVSNPTRMPALPLIRVAGSGTLKVGYTTMTIASHEHAYLDIDCDTMGCSYDGLNCNSLVSGDFPTLPAGSTTISFDGPTSVQIKPRWWQL